MRLPIRRGRAFSPQDDTRAPGVVVINEEAARKYWPGEDPVGRRILVGKNACTVIGIAANSAQYVWSSPVEAEVWFAALQHHAFLTDPGAHYAYITLVVRTAGRPADYANAVKSVVWSFDRDLPVSKVVSMDEAVAEATALPRFEMLLLLVFAAVALALAAAGIYGVLSYSIARRTREIGIRISLGASRSEVLGMLVKQGLALAVAGAIGGFAGSIFLAKLMKGMLYEVRPNDPVALAAALLTLTIAALLAAFIPARRATRIEPMIALRRD
jgi:putative ABC transport system permease protein